MSLTFFQRNWLSGTTAKSIAVLTLTAIAFLFVGRNAGRWLEITQPIVPTDYAFILPGEENTRPFVAAVLYRHKMIKKILVPTNAFGPPQADQLMPETSEVIRRVLVARGVPEESIEILPAQTTSTFGDLQILAEFLHNRPNVKVAVITNPFHMRRTLWTLRRLLKNEAGRVFLVPVPLEGFDPDRWWSDGVGISLVLGENLKLFYYWARFGTLFYWFAAAGVVVIAIFVFRRVWPAKASCKAEAEVPEQASVVETATPSYTTG